MAITNSLAVRNAAVSLVAGMVDDGAAGHGTLEVYAADGLTLLVSFDLPNPAFGAESDGAVVANAIPNATAVGAGTAAIYRVKDGDDAVLWSGEVTAGGGGGDMQLDNVSIAVGQTISISNWEHEALAQ